ncbi:MAG: TatD family hydrolase [Thermoanaerobaculia bacterium]
MICDSHGHVQMLPPAELNEVLERAEQAGVGRVLVPGTTVEDSRRAVDLAEKDGRLFAAVGVHPHETGGFESGRDLKILEELLRSARTVAVGEIGLDFHYDHSSREAQLAGFESQLAFAREKNVPVLLHNRESGPAMLAILEKAGRRENAGVFHSFTEDSAFGLRAIGLGYKISYSGMLTFKGAENIRQSARELPIAEMLVETDSPFLSPVPHRGKRCEPAFVVETARKLAEVKAASFEEVAAATTANFERLFVRK